MSRLSTPLSKLISRRGGDDQSPNSSTRDHHVDSGSLSESLGTNGEKAPEPPTFSQRTKALYEKVKKRLPDAHRKIDFVVPPALAILAKLAKDSPVPYVQNCVEIASSVYRLATLVPRQKDDVRELAGEIVDLMSCLCGELDASETRHHHPVPGSDESGEDASEKQVQRGAPWERLIKTLEDIEKDLIEWTTEHENSTLKWFWHADEVDEKIKTHRKTIASTVDEFKISALMRLDLKQDQMEVAQKKDGALLDDIMNQIGGMSADNRKFLESVFKALTHREGVCREIPSSAPGRIFRVHDDDEQRPIASGWISYKRHMATEPGFVGKEIRLRAVLVSEYRGFDGDSKKLNEDPDWRFKRYQEVLDRIPAHPHILSPLRIWPRGVGRDIVKPHIVWDWYDYNIISYQDKYPVDYIDSVKLMYQIALAVQHMHIHGLVYNLLCGSHVFLSEDGYDKKAILYNLTMARCPEAPDASLSRAPDSDMEHFMPIEMLMDMVMSKQSDVFSWAMTAIQILSGDLPLASINERLQLHKVLLQDNLIDKLRQENPITGRIPKRLTEQNSDTLWDIASKWREAKMGLFKVKDKQDVLRDRFNSIVEWESSQRTEEFWDILTPCVSEKPEDRGTMAEVVERLEKFRPDLKQTA